MLTQDQRLITFPLFGCLFIFLGALIVMKVKSSFPPRVAEADVWLAKFMEVKIGDKAGAPIHYGVFQFQKGGEVRGESSFQINHWEFENGDRRVILLTGTDGTPLRLRYDGLRFVGYIKRRDRKTPNFLRLDVLKES